MEHGVLPRTALLWPWSCSSWAYTKFLSGSFYCLMLFLQRHMACQRPFSWQVVCSDLAHSDSLAAAAPGPTAFIWVMRRDGGAT